MNISFLVHASSIIIITKFQMIQKKKITNEFQKKNSPRKKKKNRNKNIDRQHQTFSWRSIIGVKLKSSQR